MCSGCVMDAVKTCKIELFEKEKWGSKGFNSNLCILFDASDKLPVLNSSETCSNIEELLQCRFDAGADHEVIELTGKSGLLWRAVENVKVPESLSVTEPSAEYATPDEKTKRSPAVEDNRSEVECDPRHEGERATGGAGASEVVAREVGVDAAADRVGRGGSEAAATKRKGKCLSDVGGNRNESDVGCGGGSCKSAVKDDTEGTTKCAGSAVKETLGTKKKQEVVEKTQCSDKSCKEGLRTKNEKQGGVSECNNSDNRKINPNNKAVKSIAGNSVVNKENQVAVCDDVFTSTNVESPSSFASSHTTVGGEDWLQQPAKNNNNSTCKRQRRSSENIGLARKPFKEERVSPVSSTCRLRGILKRRGRSFSESHIGSLEGCLGEELLLKYHGSVEGAVVGEYGCLEGLLEECGWEIPEEEDTGDGSSSLESKKSVRFSDVEKTHLFMSKASIVNQLANDDKRAMRVKMKEQKRKLRLEKRQAQKSGLQFSGSFNSGYHNNNGYNSYDDDVTTEESDGAELAGSSSGGDTTDVSTTEDDTDNGGPDATNDTAVQARVLVERNRNANVGKKNGRNKKKYKKRVELTNSMIFQLDMEA